MGSLRSAIRCRLKCPGQANESPSGRSERHGSRIRVRARQGSASRSPVARHVYGGAGRLVLGVLAAPRVRLEPPPAGRGRRRSGGVGEHRRAGAVDVRGPDARPGPRRCLGPVPACPRRKHGLRPASREPDEGSPARVWSPSEVRTRLEDTVSAWESWSDFHQAYVGPLRDLVHHSGRVLRVTLFRTHRRDLRGGDHVVAGGGRWRAELVTRLCLGPGRFVHDPGPLGGGLPDEPNEFLTMSPSAAGSLDQGGDLQIMFGIGGGQDISQRELPHLEGWRYSAPVRVGNGAWKQRQLDVYGVCSARWTACPTCSTTLIGCGHCRPPASGVRPRQGASHATVLRAARRHRRPPVAGEGSRDLGDSGRAAATSCTRS